MIKKHERTTMLNTMFATITIFSAIFAVGAIEDCGGHCAGNENWMAFGICLTIMIVSSIMTILTTEKDA